MRLCCDNLPTFSFLRVLVACHNIPEPAYIQFLHCFLHANEMLPYPRTCLQTIFALLLAIICPCTNILASARFGRLVDDNLTFPPATFVSRAFTRERDVALSPHLPTYNFCFASCENLPAPAPTFSLLQGLVASSMTILPFPPPLL